MPNNNKPNGDQNNGAAMVNTKTLTEEMFAQVGMPKIVYVREILASDLGE